MSSPLGCGTYTAQIIIIIIIIIMWFFSKIWLVTIVYFGVKVKTLLLMWDVTSSLCVSR